MNIKSFVAIMCTLVLSNTLYSQQFTKTTIINFDPSSPSLTSLINSKISNLKDNNAVIKTLLPYVRGHNYYVLIFVFHSRGKYDYLSYEPKKESNSKLNDMVFQSSAHSFYLATQDYNFDAIRDTVILLDTLKINLNVPHPTTGTYSIALLNADGSTITNRWIKKNSNHTLILYPLTENKPSVYQKFELYCMQPDSKLISNGVFYFLSPGQLFELHQVTNVFLRNAPDMKLGELKQLTYAYLKTKYGSALNDQISAWLIKQYPQFSK